MKRQRKYGSVEGQLARLDIGLGAKYWRPSELANHVRPTETLSPYEMASVRHFHLQP